MATGFMRGLPTLFRRAEAGPAQVPFAEVTGPIAHGDQTLGKRLDLERELQRHDWIAEARVGSAVAGDVLRNAEARLVLPALKIRSRGRANRARVEVREAQALAGEAIEVGRFVEGVAITTEIGPTKVVGQDEDQVGPFRREERGEQGKEAEEERAQVGR
jgi:hypothetical protein